MLQQFLASLSRLYQKPNTPLILTSSAALAVLALIISGAGHSGNEHGRIDPDASRPPLIGAVSRETGHMEGQRPVHVADALPEQERMHAQEPTHEHEALVASAEQAALITIILDDIGNSEELGMRAIALPGAITYAVLPHTPFGDTLARAAHLAGKEVMLHAPMSNLAQHPLGEGGLTPHLSEEEFTASLRRSIDAVPHIRGVNNHMGSELTGAHLQMQWVMRELKARELYFVDSLTTPKSVAASTATEFAVPNLRRQVFLDNKATFENIDFEFRRLLEIAKKNGSAVGIGHPYPETLAYLEQVLGTLEEMGIRLVAVSEMLQLQADARTAAVQLTDAW
jgi:uncharacterized protein